MFKNIKWILFDFGGCLDSDGLHSRHLFLSHFKSHNLIEENFNIDTFQEAYTFSDNLIIENSLALNSDLHQLNELMCKHIASFLNITNFTETKKVAHAITNEQTFYLNRNLQIINKLSLNYKLGIISNFTGNLEKILDEFTISKHLDFILDSYHIGFKKPDLNIFKIAIKSCGVSPSQILYIGDNPTNDIYPALELGIKTVLLSSSPALGIADYNLLSLKDLLITTQEI